MTTINFVVIFYYLKINLFYYFTTTLSLPINP